MSNKLQKLPLALNHIEQIKNNIAGKNVVFFFDYDGTLTPIVDRPELAVLSEDVRECLRQLSQRYTVAIISGRALSNVRQLVAIDTIYYSGNHGLELAGPNCYESKGEMTDGFVEQIESAYQALKKELDPVKGVIVENKKFSLSVHYRLVEEQNVNQVEKIVNHVIAKYPKLEKRLGKKVFELRPKLNWDKGRVVLLLLKKLNLSFSEVVPIYLGDDVTDEDAFKVLQENGIGVLVSNELPQTAARYVLKDPKEVLQFLKGFIQ